MTRKGCRAVRSSARWRRKDHELPRRDEFISADRRVHRHQGATSDPEPARNVNEGIAWLYRVDETGIAPWAWAQDSVPIADRRGSWRRPPPTVAVPITPGYRR